MPDRRAIERFAERFLEILDGLDEVETEDSEALDELNAQLEDTIFLMQSIDPEEEDAAEEMEGALEELRDLPEEYRGLKNASAELPQLVLELEMAVQMAESNLKW